MNLTIDIVLGKRSRSADPRKIDSDLPWLKEFHKNIWNQTSLRPKLFRRVEVTQANYTTLQERLKELRSDRDEQGCDDKKPDVLDVKLEFLQSLSPAKDSSSSASPDVTPLSPLHRATSPSKPTFHSSEASSAEASSSRHPDPNDDEGSEASDEDSIVIQSLFPSLLSFVDLSHLGLKEKVPARFPLPLLYREEYKYISELIKRKPRGNRGSVVVSGQPGLGKFLVSVSHRI